MDQINARETRMFFEDRNDEKGKVIKYENIQKRKEKIVFNLLGINDNDTKNLKESIMACFEIIKNKDAIVTHTDTIKECFEISCYILYDRQIMYEVICKQKAFGIDYVADFLRYILRVFVRRYNESPILTKNQCTDIKSFCKCMLKINNSIAQHCDTIDKISSKEIVELLKVIAI